MADALNTGTFEERLAEGKQREAEVLALLQHSFWSVIPATEQQDKAEKIDAWVRWKGVSYSVAVKWRDSGRDLGLAVVRPYDTKAFPLQWQADHVPYDRDAQHYADLYALGSEDGVTIVTGASVKRHVDYALENLARYGKMAGANYELKNVLDRGASGYTSAQQKLIVYINPESLERVDV